MRERIRLKLNKAILEKEKVMKINQWAIHKQFSIKVYLSSSTNHKKYILNAIKAIKLTKLERTHKHTIKNAVVN